MLPETVGSRETILAMLNIHAVQMLCLMCIEEA